MQIYQNNTQNWESYTISQWDFGMDPHHIKQLKMLAVE
jgi:hypothetical protein